ncbi:MAG TPA: inorganic diphosphatase, partial [Salinisphaera sp.]
NKISHFFEHYKDHEHGKWSKISGWENAAKAKAEIEKSIAAYNKG